MSTAKLSPFLMAPSSVFGKPVCRLGLASRGQSSLTPGDIEHALSRGVNFLNWPGFADTPGGADSFSEVVRQLGRMRESIVMCVQLGARSAADAADELQSILSTLGTDYLDIVTLYYVEEQSEWEVLRAPDGAIAFLKEAR